MRLKRNSILITLTILCLQVQGFALYTFDIKGKEVSALFANYYASGKIKELYLNRPVKLKVRGELVGFFGKPMLYNLSNDMDLRNNRALLNPKIKARREGLSYGRLSLYPNGNVKAGYLQRIVELSVGGRRPAFTPMYYPDKRDIYFYEDGSIESGFLDKDELIDAGKDTILVRAAVSEEKRGMDVYFHDNEMLKAAYLVSNSSIGLPQGKCLARPEMISEYGDIKFYSNGNVKSLYLAQPLKIAANADFLTLKPYTGKYGDVFFYENGIVRKAALNNDAELNAAGNNIKLKAGRWIEFYDTAAIKSGFLLERSRLKVRRYEMLFEGGTEIQFYEDGEIRWGRLAASFHYGIETSAGHSYERSIIEGEWIYHHRTKSGSKFYGIDSEMKLKRDTPFSLAGYDFVLPVGTRVGKSGRDYIFDVITPSNDINVGKGKLILKGGKSVKLGFIEDKLLKEEPASNSAQ